MIVYYGGVDILVNNVVINLVFGLVEEVFDFVFDKIMGVNVKVFWVLLNFCLFFMKERGGGSVINISFVEGLYFGFGFGLYSVSKVVMIMLIKN